MERNLLVSIRDRFMVASGAVIAACWALFSSLPARPSGLLADILNPALAGTACAFAIVIYRLNLRTPFREIGPVAVVVLLLLAIAEILWSVQVEVFGIEPAVSVADAFWLTGYFTLMAMLVKVIHASQVETTSRILLIQLAYWLSLAPVLAYVILASVTSQELSGLEQLVWNMYTFADAVMLSLLLYVIWLHWRGQLQDFWIILGLSMAFMAVGDILYAVYDAAGLYYVGSLPDVFYVSTYATMSMGFAMLVRRKVRFTSLAPTAGTRTAKAQSTSLARGRTYVIWGTDTKPAYELMMKGLEEGLQGLVIARRHPRLIRADHGIENIPILWLSSSAGPDTINPANLGILADTVTRFLERGSDSVVLLDGIEMLTTYTDFRKVLIAIDHLKDVAMAHGSRLIIPADRRALSEKEAALLEKQAVVVSA